MFKGVVKSLFGDPHQKEIKKLTPLVEAVNDLADEMKNKNDGDFRQMMAEIGLAAGDKNHGPSEMAWRLASSLAELQRFDPEDVFGRYLDWHRQGRMVSPPSATKYRK